MGKWAKALAGVTHGVREPWGQGPEHCFYPGLLDDLDWTPSQVDFPAIKPAGWTTEP